MTGFGDLLEQARIDAVIERFPDYQPPTTWRNNAACLGVAVNLFYEHGAQQAAEVCRTCPARANCLLDALHTEANVADLNDIAGRRWITAKARMEIVRAHRGPRPIGGGHRPATTSTSVVDQSVDVVHIHTHARTGRDAGQ